MKKNVFFRLAIFLAALSLFSCETHEDALELGGEKIKTSLTYVWDDALVNDTAFLYLNQTLGYIDQGKAKTLYPKAVVKLYPKLDTVYYAVGYDPTPFFQKTKDIKSYKGKNPRKRIISQEITLNDGQTLIAEISYDIYSYMSQGSEISFETATLETLKFEKAEVLKGYGCFLNKITLSVPWEIKSLKESGKKNIQVFYAKKQVKEVDKLLTTSYDHGIEWTDEAHFCLFVSKKEIWRINGEKNYKFSSPWLEFSLNASSDKTVWYEEIDFSTKLSFDQEVRNPVEGGVFEIKKGNIRQKVMFSSRSSYFEDVFSYPSFEASFLIDDKRFEFDLEAQFKEEHLMLSLEDNQFENKTTGYVSFAGKTFEKTVSTKLLKKPDTPPVVELKRGKVLGVFVSAVFDMDAIGHNDNITKKCVLVRYEKGYEWGICDYQDAFPSSFKFQESSFDAFNSAAKRDVGMAFELARVVENKSTLLWYGENNQQISGIDALTAMIYAWEHNLDGRLASVISDYKTVYADDGSKVDVFAPNGVKMTFSANPS